MKDRQANKTVWHYFFPRNFWSLSNDKVSKEKPGWKNCSRSLRRKRHAWTRRERRSEKRGSRRRRTKSSRPFGRTRYFLLLLFFLISKKYLKFQHKKPDADLLKKMIVEKLEEFDRFDVKSVSNSGILLFCRKSAFLKIFEEKYRNN